MPPPLITFLITDLHRGGTPLLLASLAPALATHFDGTAKIEVVSIAPRGEVAALLRAGGIKSLSLEARSNRDFLVVPRFAEYLKMRRPQIVFSLLIHANLLVALARPHVDHKFTWIQSIHTVQEKPAWHWYAQGLISGMADAVVAPSRAILNKMQGYGPVPRPTVIPNGIDLPRFQNALPISNPPWPNDVTVIGYIGRFDPVKRLPLLIRALKLLPANYHLVLIGYGTEEENLRRLSATLNLTERIHFIGPTTEPERWYKSFDLFCSPSAAEGFGLTLVEAAAAGLPVIACDTPAVRETLSDAIWLSSDPNPVEVSERIAVANGRKAQGNGRNALWSVSSMVANYCKLLGDLFEKPLN